MRIGIDASCWTNLRGYGRFTRDLMAEMVSSFPEHEYHFFIDEVSSKGCNFPDGSCIHRVETSKSATETATSDDYRSPLDLLRMSRAVSRYPLDILFFPSVYTFFPILKKVPALVAIHDVIPEMYPQMVFPTRRSQLFWTLKVKAAVWQADRILTVSNYSKSGIVKYLKVNPDKVGVTIEAAGPEFVHKTTGPERDSILQDYGISPDKHFFLYVGGIGPHKNLNALIKAYNFLQEEEPNGQLKLVIVGDFRNDVFWRDRGIQQQAENSTSQENIIFTGRVPDQNLPHFYSAAIALILPSFSEGFGLPALEAMNCGTPVIASKTTALPEVVGNAGVFFDPENYLELKAAMTKLFSDKSLRDKLAQTALRRAGQFSWKEAAKMVMEEMQKTIT